MDKSPDAFRTISEVADWLDTPAHVLRFWESRFTQVKPIKRAGGRRYYRPGDMALLGGIKKLLHEDGMTIRGVQKLLREQGVKYVAGFSQPLDGNAVETVDDSQTAPPIPAAPMAVDVPEGAFDAPAEEETPKVVQFERPAAKTPEPVPVEPETPTDVETEVEVAVADTPPAPVSPPPETLETPEAPLEATSQEHDTPEQDFAPHEEQEKEDEKENTVAKSQTASGALPGQTAFDFSALDHAPAETEAAAAPAVETPESAPVAPTEEVAEAAATDAQPVETVSENIVLADNDTAAPEPTPEDIAPETAASEATSEPVMEAAIEEVIAPEPAEDAETRDISAPVPAQEAEESALSPRADDPAPDERAPDEPAADTAEAAEDAAPEPEPEPEPIQPIDAPHNAAPIEAETPEIVEDDPEDDDSAFEAADISALAVLNRQTMVKIPAAERAALIARAEALHEKFHSGA